MVKKKLYEMKSNLILLYSGGYDSTLLLQLALKLYLTPFCLLFDYNQVHSEELKFAENTCKELKQRYEIIKIPSYAKSKLTFGDVTYSGVSEWHVPSRNLIFISIAASIAESIWVNGVLWR